MEESTKLVDESTEALWYVVHTYSGYENKVANDQIGRASCRERV